MKKRKWSVFSFPSDIGYKELIKFAKDIGLDAIEPYQTAELAGNDPDKADLVLKMAKENSLDISCYSIRADLVGENYASEMERVKSCMRTARRLGSKYFHHTIAPDLGCEMPDFDEVFSKCFDRVKELCLYADSIGMTDLFEDQGLVFNGKKNFTKFVNALESEGIPFGIVLDAGNSAFVNEDAADMLSELSERIVHVHVKDYLIKTQPFETGRCYKTIHGTYMQDIRMGLGDINLDKVFALMDKVGYEGYFSLEYCGDEGLEGIKASLENLKARYEK
ncbi:MAG: sugar phosphate isomerase/epimerase [Clostridia bacterium]|nr:sugar phosphate isomerase/epimerase [Clostridia bacterium]